MREALSKFDDDDDEEACDLIPECTSALLNYCDAVASGNSKMAEYFKEEAISEYMWWPSVYDQEWATILPPAFRGMAMRAMGFESPAEYRFPFFVQS